MRLAVSLKVCASWEQHLTAVHYIRRMRTSLPLESSGIPLVGVFVAQKATVELFTITPIGLRCDPGIDSLSMTICYSFFDSRITIKYVVITSCESPIQYCCH